MDTSFSNIHEAWPLAAAFVILVAIPFILSFFLWRGLTKQYTKKAGWVKYKLLLFLISLPLMPMGIGAYSLLWLPTDTCKTAPLCPHMQYKIERLKHELWLTGLTRDTTFADQSAPPQCPRDVKILLERRYGGQRQKVLYDFAYADIDHIYIYAYPFSTHGIGYTSWERWQKLSDRWKETALKRKAKFIPDIAEKEIFTVLSPQNLQQTTAQIVGETIASCASRDGHQKAGVTIVDTPLHEHVIQKNSLTVAIGGYVGRHDNVPPCYGGSCLIYYDYNVAGFVELVASMYSPNWDDLLDRVRKNYPPYAYLESTSKTRRLHINWFSMSIKIDKDGQPYRPVPEGADVEAYVGDMIQELFQQDIILYKRYPPSPPYQHKGQRLTHTKMSH